MDADDGQGVDDEAERPQYFASEPVSFDWVTFERAEVGAMAMRDVMSRLTGHEVLGARVIPRGGCPVVRTEISVEDAEELSELIERFMELIDLEFGKYPNLVTGDESWRRSRLPDDIDYGQAHPVWYAVADGADGSSYVRGYARAYPVAERLSAALARVLLRARVDVDPVCGQEGEDGAAARFDLEPNECERLVGYVAALLVTGFAHRPRVDGDGLRS